MKLEFEDELIIEGVARAAERIDSFAPAHSPATLAGLTVYPARSRRAVFCT